jgi:hypothetical protein
MGRKLKVEPEDDVDIKSILLVIVIRNRIRLNTETKLYNATSDNAATSMTPPTRCKLPVTRTSIPSICPDLESNVRTTSTACSIDGKTCMLVVGNVGTSEDHAEARSCCVFRRMPSESRIATAVKSEIGTMFGAVQRQRKLNFVPPLKPPSA